MRVPVATMVIAGSVAGAIWGCRASPPVRLHDGLLMLRCDTALKRPLRPAEIPEVSVVAGYGSITGIVFRAGTGNGIDGASIRLSPQDSATQQSYRLRVTGQTGGFAFDSVVPGQYRLHVVAAWEHPESSFVAIAGNRIDTVRFPLRAPEICTRS
jgi:hypothetical protein